jgi:hypothetical protein
MKRLLPVLMGFVFLLLSSTDGWSLPLCPEIKHAVWNNCVGTYTNNQGHKFVGEWEDGKFKGASPYDGEFIFNVNWENPDKYCDNKQVLKNWFISNGKSKNGRVPIRLKELLKFHGKSSEYRGNEASGTVDTEGAIDIRWSTGPLFFSMEGNFSSTKNAEGKVELSVLAGKGVSPCDGTFTLVRVGNEIPQAPLRKDNIVVKKQKAELEKKYIGALDGLWKMEVDCPPFTALATGFKFSSGKISGNIDGFYFSGSVDVDGIISGIAAGDALFEFKGNISNWKKGVARGTLADTGGNCGGTWILTKKKAPDPEAVRLATLAEEARLASLEKKREAELRSAEEARLAKLKEERKAEERSIAQKRAAEEARLAKLKEEREAEERRIAQKRAAEEARLAKLKEEREAEERRIAQERAAAKRRKVLYDAIVSGANSELTNLQDYISVNPETAGLMEIVTDVAAVKAALEARKESAIERALVSLRATLSKEKGFIAFQKEKEKKLQRRIAEERRHAEETRRREAAEAKRRKEELRRKLAAQVNREREKLKTHATFLKRQVAKNIVSNSKLAQALVPLVKRLEVGLSSNDLSVLEGLKGRATDALRKHGLSNQYAEVRKLMAAARKAKREKAAAAEREKKAAVFAAKERKKDEARLVAEKKAAAVLAARQAKERKALQKQDKALAARQEKYHEAVAVVIGNRKYANRVPEVSFAHNDARAMRKYLIDLGYREGNIIYIKDATQSQLLAVFGTEKSHRGKLFSYVRPGESDVTVFYSGHGVPGLKDRRGYLLPVDADPNLVELNGYPIDLLYGNLNKVGAKTMRVYMDACFSGDSPRGMLVRATSGISVKPLMPKKKAGSAMISITAAQGDQFASWDEDAKHGLFTKHLLTALGGTADKGRYGNGDGKVTVEEVKTYLDREMTYQARRRYNRDQVATVQGDSKLVLSSYR